MCTVPQTAPQNKLSVPALSELRTKLTGIGNPTPNHLYRELNFPNIDWQMETADGGTLENQVQANDFLQFSLAGTMLTAIHRGANEKK